MILRALGLREPGYAHISLILGDDGTPLSKRNGSMSMSDMRSSGYLPLAMINFLARLGHRYEAEGLLSAETLAQDFSPDRLGKAPARFDRHQLDYYQKQALLSLNDEAFLAWVAAHIDSSILARIPADERLVFISAMRDNIAVPADAALWINASYAESLDYTDESRQVLETAGEDFLAAAIAASDNAQDFKSLASTVKTETGCKGKQLFMPLRHALTGQGHGPELGRLFELKGREWIRKRLSDAHAALQA